MVVAQSINQLNEDIRYKVSWRTNGCLASGIKKTKMCIKTTFQREKRYSKLGIKCKKYTPEGTDQNFVARLLSLLASHMIYP